VSVRLFRHSTAVAACGVFAAERRAGMSYRLTAAGAAHSSNGTAARRSAATAGSLVLTAEVRV